MYTFVSKNAMLIFDIWYSNLMDSCFALNSLKHFIRSFLLLVHVKKMSSINLREVNENPLINGYISFQYGPWIYWCTMALQWFP